MGIPYYVASLVKKNPSIQMEISNDQILNFDYVGIDFNCFIHTYIDDTDPVNSVISALRNLRSKFHCNGILIAFDGLVPYAKMVQQRYRRFRKSDNPSTFDRHQISPGTPYMKELAAAIHSEFPDIEISDTTEPGEGEHKIFSWARSKPDCKNLCVYGLDADLVLISLIQSHLHGINVSLLREMDKQFNLFSVTELAKSLPMAVEKYVPMCIFCFGNDFMPAIGMFSLREGGHERALRYFQENDLGESAKRELDIYLRRRKESDAKILAPDGHCLEIRMGIQLFDGVLDWEPVVNAYWKTYDWVREYFETSRVPDWNWVYPYAEAPLLETICAYPRFTTPVWEHPEPSFTITDQLRFILPATSLHKAKKLVRFPDEIYDEQTEMRHKWMKRFNWECDPYISLPWNPSNERTEIHPLLF